MTLRSSFLKMGKLPWILMRLITGSANNGNADVKIKEKIMSEIERKAYIAS